MAMMTFLCPGVFLYIGIGKQTQDASPILQSVPKLVKIKTNTGNPGRFDFMIVYIDSKTVMCTILLTGDHTGAFETASYPQYKIEINLCEDY